MAFSTLQLVFSFIIIAPLIWLKWSHPKISLMKKNDHLFVLYGFFVIMTLMVIMPTVGHTLHSFDESLNFIIGDKQASNRSIFLFLHIVAALASILLGPALLFKQYRMKFPAHHRLLGKIYVFSTLFSAVIVLPLSLTNSGGPYAQMGFTTMAILWIFFTWEGYRHARNKNFITHRRYMLRSYAMTFAFVHVNVTYPIFLVYVILEGQPLAIKMMQSVVSWSFNLLIVEIYLAATNHQGSFISPKKFVKQLFRRG